MKLERRDTRPGTAISLSVKIQEVVPGLYMVEVRKRSGDTLEYHKFYRALFVCVKDLVWHSEPDRDGGEWAREGRREGGRDETSKKKEDRLAMSPAVKQARRLSWGWENGGSSGAQQRPVVTTRP